MLNLQRRAWLLHLQATHSLADVEVARPHGRSKWKPGLEGKEGMKGLLIIIFTWIPGGRGINQTSSLNQGDLKEDLGLLLDCQVLVAEVNPKGVV